MKRACLICFFSLFSLVLNAQILLFNSFICPTTDELYEELVSYTSYSEQMQKTIDNLRERAYKTTKTEDDRTNLASFLLRKIYFRSDKSYKDNEYLILEAYDLFPRAPQVEATWGDMYYSAGNFEKAITHYENAYYQDKDDEQILLKAAISSLNSMDYRKAIDYLDSYERKKSTQFVSQYYMGYAYYELKDFYLAQKHWETALSLATTDQHRQLVEDALSNIKEKNASQSNTTTKDETQRFSIHYAGSSQRDLGDVTFQLLEEVFFLVTDSLRYYPKVKIHVVFFLTEEYYQTYQDWSAAVAQGISIAIPLKSGYKSRDYLRGLLAHEFTHTITALRTNNRCPLWLDEGLAQYHEFQAAYGSSDTLRPDYQNIYRRDFVQNKKSMKLTDVAKNIKSQNRENIARGYIASYLAARCLEYHYGKQVFDELLVSLGEGNSIDNALSRVIGRNLTDFQKQYELWLKNL